MVQFNITLGVNTPLFDTTQVVDIKVNRHTGKHDEAIISIALSYKESNERIIEQFQFGERMKIELGDNGSPITLVFEGMIQSIGFQANQAMGPIYTVKAVALHIESTQSVPHQPTLSYAFDHNLLEMDFTCAQNNAIAGQILVQGNANITIGELLQISATESFADKLWLITGLMHQVHQGNWFTKVYLS